MPAGEYKFHPSSHPQGYLICDGYPEAQAKRHEVFVHVTTPAGTVQETFFDPAAVGSAVAAAGSSGVMSPTEITVERTGAWTTAEGGIA